MNLGMMIFSSEYYVTSSSVWDSDVNTLGKLFKSDISAEVIKLHIENLVQRYKAQDIIILSVGISGLYTY